MNGFELMVNSPVSLAITGKFQAPTPEWIHMTRLLLDFELIVITEGALYVGGDKTNYVVNKGEYLLLPPSTHQYGYKASHCSFYWLHFICDHHTTIDLTSNTPFYQAGKIVIPQHGLLKNAEKIIVLMKQLQDCVRCFNETTMNDYMSTIILLELYNQLSLQSHSSTKMSKQQIYNDIIDYIKWNCHENIKVSQIANYFGYNEKYLSHLFTTVSGSSLKQYIIQEKMEVAKFILSDTNYQINDIASQLGYYDSHNFMKSFKKIVGLTPTEYRNAYSKRLLYYQ